METLHSRFSLRRSYLLARIGLLDEWRPFLLSGVVIGGLILFSFLFLKSTSTLFLLKLMLFMGMVLVSKLFSVLHHREKGIYTLMLPASVEEKFAVKLLMTTVVFYGYAIFICLAGGWFAHMLSSLLFEPAPYQILNPFTMEGAEQFFVFLFFHSMFFSGSLFFKSNSFLKTVVSMMATFFFILTIIGGIYLKNSLVMPGNSQFYLRLDNSNQLMEVLGTSYANIVQGIKLVIYIVVPTLLYGLSYFKFKHYEIKG
jgi:hypothetical protein